MPRRNRASLAIHNFAALCREPLSHVTVLRPHRLRDAFAVELLLAGVPIERVSVLLGHTSVRITERHYNPWKQGATTANRSRSDPRMGARPTRESAKSDPIPRPSQGTRGVHGGKRARNSFQIKAKRWCPGWESNPHEEKSPEDFKSSASAIPPPGHRQKLIDYTQSAGLPFRGILVFGLQCV